MIGLGAVRMHLGARGRESATAHRGVNQGALAGPSAMAPERVCVSRRTFPHCGRGLRRFCLFVVVAIEATPSCIDHGVRAIEALGR